MLSRGMLPASPHLRYLAPSVRKPFMSFNRRYSTPTEVPPNRPSSYRQGLSRYGALRSPFAKVFLGAIFTYQVLYWCWLKLEMDEEKCERNKLTRIEEVAALEAKARELAGLQK